MKKCQHQFDYNYLLFKESVQNNANSSWRKNLKQQFIEIVTREINEK